MGMLLFSRLAFKIEAITESIHHIPQRGIPLCLAE